MSKRLPAPYSGIGCRIPKDYFWVIDWGESEWESRLDPMMQLSTWPASRITTCSFTHSVLPPEAVELPHLPDIHHGSVLESIIAVQHTDKPGTRITAGLLMARVCRSFDGSHLGGFACEYAGNGWLEEAESICVKPCSSSFRGVIKQRSTNSSLGNRSCALSRHKNRSGQFLSALGSPVILCPHYNPKWS
jgi:hypothetical protein